MTMAQHQCTRCDEIFESDGTPALCDPCGELDRTPHFEPRPRPDREAPADFYEDWAAYEREYE